MRRYTDLNGSPFEVRHGEDLLPIGARRDALIVLDVDPDAHLDGRSGVAIDGATARGLVADLLDALGAKTLDEQLQAMLEAVAPAWAREQQALKAGTVARMFLEMGRVLERAKVEADRREVEGVAALEPGPDQDIAATVAEHAAGPMPPAPDELEYERNEP